MRCWTVAVLLGFFRECQSSSATLGRQHMHPEATKQRPIVDWSAASKPLMMLNHHLIKKSEESRFVQGKKHWVKSRNCLLSLQQCMCMDVHRSGPTKGTTKSTKGPTKGTPRSKVKDFHLAGIEIDNEMYVRNYGHVTYDEEQFWAYCVFYCDLDERYPNYCSYDCCVRFFIPKTIS